MKSDVQGVIEYLDGGRKPDYLYRVSIKGIILNDTGEVLLVKENGRDWWDLPGGGMDHGESIKAAIARELKEEVNLKGDFTYRIVHVDEPGLLERSRILQIRLVFIVVPEIMDFEPGEDGDEVAFLSLEKLREVDEAKFHYLGAILGDR